MTRTKTLIQAALAAAALALPVSAQAPKPATRPAPAATRPAARPGVPQRPAAAAEPVESPREIERRRIAEASADWGTMKIEQLVKFDYAEGHFASKWVAKTTQRKPVRVRIEGSDATWLVNHVDTGSGAFYSLHRFLLDGPETDFWMVQLSTQDGLGSTTLLAQGGEKCPLLSLAYQQMPEEVVLAVSERGAVRNRKQVSAPNLTLLRKENPDLVYAYLLPLLRQMTGQPILRPGAGDVYRVFADVPADPAVTAKIDELLPDFVADDPKERERANAALVALGRPGALAAMRYDVDALLPEQRSRLDALVKRHTRLDLDDPARAAADPNFLVECLEDEDAAVRKSAKDLLERVLARKVDFDPAAPPEKRATAAAAIRSDLTRRAAEGPGPEKPKLP